MSLTEKNWGEIDGQTVSLFSLKNQQGFEVTLCPWGATVVGILAPDRENVFEDVTLGYDEFSSYLDDDCYFGCIVGRFGNRIEHGHFELDGQRHQLKLNIEDGHLHGGVEGFNKKLWALKSKGDNFVEFEYFSKDGEENYPGNLTLCVRYSVTEENALDINYLARCDQKTVLNPTNHCYFNLSGDGKNILKHQFKINAETYLPMNENWISRGEIDSLEGHALDFRHQKSLIDLVKDNTHQVVFAGEGVDHNYVISKRLSSANERGEYLAASALDPNSGRCLEVWTDQPGVQFYSGNMLDGRCTGKAGKTYEKYDGFCLETQHFPNSPNVASFPSTELDVGQVFSASTRYLFRTET